MATYEVNWNYSPAVEDLDATNTIENVGYPLVNYLDVDYHNGSSLHSAIYRGSYYLTKQDYTLVNSSWSTAVKEVLANGTTKTVAGGYYLGIVPTYNEPRFGHLRTSADFPNASSFGPTYAVAYPSDIKLEIHNLPIYQTRFETPEWIEASTSTPICAHTLYNDLGTYPNSNIRVKGTNFLWDQYMDVSSAIPDTEIAASTSYFNWDFPTEVGGEYFTRPELEAKFPVSGSSSSRITIYKDYWLQCFNPNTKKHLYYNPSASDNVTKKARLDGGQLKIDNQTVTSGWLDIEFKDADYTYAFQGGIDATRRTSIVVKDAKVEAYNNGAYDSPINVGSTATEVFSDVGHFIVDGVEIWVNRGYGINAASLTTAFRAIKYSQQSEYGSSFTLLEVNIY